MNFQAISDNLIHGGPTSGSFVDDGLRGGKTAQEHLQT